LIFSLVGEFFFVSADFVRAFVVATIWIGCVGSNIHQLKSHDWNFQVVLKFWHVGRDKEEYYEKP